jgi:hypothetical protein
MRRSPRGTAHGCVHGKTRLSVELCKPEPRIGLDSRPRTVPHRRLETGLYCLVAGPLYQIWDDGLDTVNTVLREHHMTSCPL